MRGLSYIIFLLFIQNILFSQSPHGNNLKIDCAICHTAINWKYDSKYSTFNHDNTEFLLKGQHREIDCKLCHTSLIFDQASSDCFSCHSDVHQQTLGNDCSRCHNSNAWIISNIYEIHEKTSFPLTGVHRPVNCSECHSKESYSVYEPTGVYCIDCHKQDYNNSLNPDHNQRGFSENCEECHNLTNSDWNTTNVDHSFWPLEKGHQVNDCAMCHKSENYSDISTDCISCHKSNYDNTSLPDHNKSGFDNDCVICHTTDPDWNPVNYSQHDGIYFPIYSGKHLNTWNNCTDCHINKSDFSVNSCIVCHINPETDLVHEDIPGYTYEDNACLTCHPTGDADNSFNHNNTAFPLTGAHLTTLCIDCHTSVYVGTSTLCVSCHEDNYNSSVNPDHKQLGISDDCQQCHETGPGWEPARFDNHNDYYPLNGAHAVISSDCVKCHNGDYNSTPNTCFGCHSADYNQAMGPNHIQAMFSNECETCHSESAWRPSTFDHDGMYFPIYSGKHKDQWDQCTECHTNTQNYSIFTCVSCHKNPETDNDHITVNGYIYEDNACLACHPTGDADVNFDHNSTGFPLTGSHLSVNCNECHTNGFQNTPNQCVDCHLDNYNQSQNPNHQSLGLSDDCATCHTTAPDWKPASFADHNSYFELKGAHAAISNECASCHNGNYINTPNTCIGCHQPDYNATTDPDHKALQFPNECESCHSESAWVPSTFDHDGMFFPIYSGKHKGQWDQCLDCHINPGNYTIFSCVVCHQNPGISEEHDDVPGYVFADDACLACHPTGNTDLVFDHNTTIFPLTGGHFGIECTQCHVNGFNQLPTTCVSCHVEDFNQSVNPNHNSLGFSNDCENCHTTNPGWNPAIMPTHDEYYQIQGAHVSLDCNACHNGNYVNTPNTCYGCHSENYNSTTDPNHVTNEYSTECAICHNQNAWSPSEFYHAAVYPLTGAHATIAEDCALCHQNGYNNTPNSCVGCHQGNFNNTSNPNHSSLGFSNDCEICHTTNPGWNPALMPEHNNYYVIEGAHTSLDCASCHNGNYNNTPNTCFGCHTSEYNSTTDPNHVAEGYPTDCTICHSQNAWTPSEYDHNNIYPLTGAHAEFANDCVQCHSGGYSNTPNSCVGCHQDNFNNTSNPNHSSLGFSNDCEICHTTNPGWNPALMPEHNNYYVIEGAHTSLDCASCHNGNYNNTPNTCYGCHVSEYNSTNDPDHEAAQFPTDCESCHTQNAWEPSTFDHDGMYFPIYSGKHEGEWDQCTDCHIVANNYTIFSCIDCHEHDNQAEVDNDHEGVSGYVYESNACYACHPNGND